MTEITDPATEFVSFARRIRKHNSKSGSPSYKVIEELLVHSDAASAIQFYAATNRRCQRLKEQFLSVNTPTFIRTYKDRVISSIENIQNIALSDNFASNWAQVTATHIKEEDVVAIEFSAIHLQSDYIFGLLDKAELSKLGAAISDALEELGSTPDIPPWAVPPLREGLRDARFIVANYQVLGHDETVESLFRLISTATGVSSAMPTRADRETFWRKLERTFLVVMIIKEILVTPAELTQAGIMYRGWAQSLASQVQQISPGVKALPKPPDGQDDV